MSSSEPGGSRRNRRCEIAASKSPTRITCFGKLGVERNSRIARRYAIPETASGMRKDGAPRLLNWREQIVSATSKMVPRM
jgi:hypothetical protein